MKKLSFIFFILLWGNKSYSKREFNDALKEVFAGLDVNKLSEISKKALKNREQLLNLSNSIDLRAGVGRTKVGSYLGGYDEIEISYDIELSGEKYKYKSDILPILSKISELDSVLEINTIKYSIIKLIVAHGVILERVDHIRERKSRLIKLIRFLNNYKQKSAQAIANKSLIRLKIEDIEYSIESLNLELKAIRSLLKETFGDQYKEIAFSHSPSLNLYKKLFEEINKKPSFLKKSLEYKLKVLKVKEEISKRSWIPNLTVYAGRNAQDQLGTQPQITEYIGVGIKIPTDFSYNKKRGLSEANIAIEKIKQRQTYLDNIRTESAIETSILKKLHFFKSNNKRKLQLMDIELDRHFQKLSKGLLSLQTYFELDSMIHERLHTVLEYKLTLVDDFYSLLNSKKQSIDVLGELM